MFTSKTNLFQGGSFFYNNKCSHFKSITFLSFLFSMLPVYKPFITTLLILVWSFHSQLLNVASKKKKKSFLLLCYYYFCNNFLECIIFFKREQICTFMYMLIWFIIRTLIFFYRQINLKTWEVSIWDLSVCWFWKVSLQFDLLYKI